MKVGEHWKHLYGGMSVMSDSVRGNVVEITELVNRNVKPFGPSDWVFFIIIEDDHDGVGMHGCLRREIFLKEFVKVYNANISSI